MIRERKRLDEQTRQIEFLADLMITPIQSPVGNFHFISIHSCLFPWKFLEFLGSPPFYYQSYLVPQWHECKVWRISLQIRTFISVALVRPVILILHCFGLKLRLYASSLCFLYCAVGLMFLFHLYFLFSQRDLELINATFKRMIAEGFTPDNATYTTLITACALAHDADAARAHFNRMIQGPMAASNRITQLVSENL